MLASLRARGDLVVGDNQPYSGKDAFGYTVEFQAQRTRLPHLMLELRLDEIATPARAEAHGLGLWPGRPAPRAWKRPTDGAPASVRGAGALDDRPA